MLKDAKNGFINFFDHIEKVSTLFRVSVSCKMCNDYYAICLRLHKDSFQNLFNSTTHCKNQHHDVIA